MPYAIGLAVTAGACVFAYWLGYREGFDAGNHAGWKRRLNAEIDEDARARARKDHWRRCDKYDETRQSDFAPPTPQETPRAQP